MMMAVVVGVVQLSKALLGKRVLLLKAEREVENLILIMAVLVAAIVAGCSLDCVQLTIEMLNPFVTEKVLRGLFDL